MMSFAPILLICIYTVFELDAYLFVRGIVPLDPSAQAVLIFLVTACWSFASRRLRRVSKEAQLLYLCIILYIGTQIFAITGWREIPSDITILFYWTYSLMLVASGYILGKLARQRVPALMFCLLLLLFGTSLYDIIGGGISDSATWGRSAATLRNPNTLGMIAILLCLGSVRWGKATGGELAALIITGLTASFSGSRTALLCFCLLSYCLLQHWWLQKGPFPRIALRSIIPALLSISVSIIFILTLLVSRYEAPVAALSDANGHDTAAISALEIISVRPWLGNGTGYVHTQELGPHNMLLRGMIDGGVIGLAGLTSILLGLFWVGRARGDYSIILLSFLLACFSVTSHNLTETRPVLIISGMLLAFSSFNISRASSGRRKECATNINTE